MLITPPPLSSPPCEGTAERWQHHTLSTAPACIENNPGSLCALLLSPNSAAGWKLMWRGAQSDSPRAQASSSNDIKKLFCLREGSRFKVWLKYRSAVPSHGGEDKDGGVITTLLKRCYRINFSSLIMIIAGISCRLSHTNLLCDVKSL